MCPGHPPPVVVYALPFPVHVTGLTLYIARLTRQHRNPGPSRSWVLPLVLSCDQGPWLLARRPSIPHQPWTPPALNAVPKRPTVAENKVWNSLMQLGAAHGDAKIGPDILSHSQTCFSNYSPQRFDCKHTVYTQRAASYKQGYQGLPCPQEQEPRGIDEHLDPCTLKSNPLMQSPLAETPHERAGSGCAKYGLGSAWRRLVCLCHIMVQACSVIGHGIRKVCSADKRYPTAWLRFRSRRVLQLDTNSPEYLLSLFEVQACAESEQQVFDPALP